MSHEDVLSEIERLAALLDKGAITAEEFAVAKQDLLARLAEPEPAPLAVVPAAAPGLGVAPVDPAMQRASNAFIIELIAGLLGFLGIGYMYAGRTDGVVRLVAWWFGMAVMWTAVGLLSIVLIGLCLIPGALVIQFGVPIYSATQLRKSLLAESGLLPDSPAVGA